MPCDLYKNSGVKTIVLFNVRNIEGQNHSEHTVGSTWKFCWLHKKLLQHSS